MWACTCRQSTDQPSSHMLEWRSRECVRLITGELWRRRAHAHAKTRMNQSLSNGERAARAGDLEKVEHDHSVSDDTQRMAYLRAEYDMRKTAAG